MLSPFAVINRANSDKNYWDQLVGYDASEHPVGFQLGGTYFMLKKTKSNQDPNQM
jgi:hypothetical protein